MRRVASGIMKILVTGAAGTLGSAVVAHLRSLGWSVRAHDLLPLDPAQADEVVTGDLRDPEQVRPLVDGMAVAAFDRGSRAISRSPEPKEVTDTFSLKGFEAAYAAIVKACPPK